MQNEQEIKISEEDLLKPDESEEIIIEFSDLMTDTAPQAGKNMPAMDWDTLQNPLPTKEVTDVILVIDTSGSMDADDYSPNRLEAAKEAARKFTMRKVMQNYKDRVGVIGFGGSACVVHPLDSDLDQVEASIDQLSITHTGTLIGLALRAAEKALSGTTSRKRGIILLSDGADKFDSSDPVGAARKLKGIKVFTIGIGTLKGGMANLPIGKQRVVLNDEILQEIARVTGGRYVYSPDVVDLQKIYTELADIY
jgi:Ca-activated chloride channel homolog